MEKLSAYIVYIPYAVILVALSEFAYVLLRQKDRDKKETAANFSIWAIGQVLKPLLTGGFFLGFLIPISKWSPYSLPINGWTAALTLLTADFIYYWNHRASHDVRLFWTYHSVHHSSHEFNLSTAIRLPWIGLFGDTLFYIPAVLLGFNPILLLLSKTIVLVAQEWIHSEQIGKLGWFDKYFNSPSNHRVHHGRNIVYLDKNHGGILMIWDHLFGTYQAEIDAEPVLYGLTKPIDSYNPWVINFHETASLFKQMREAGSLHEALQYAFRGPGWMPAVSSESTDKESVLTV